MRSFWLTLNLSLAIAACSDNSTGNDPSGNSGGAPRDTTNVATSGGAQVSGGNPASNSGGQVWTTASGGTISALGGTTGQGGSVIAGSPCAVNCPTGTVTTCFGNGCPMGACDHGACSKLYASPAGPATIYCTAGQNGAYCLETVTNDISYWAVTCSDGAPQIVYCPDGCGVSSLGAAC